MSRCTVRCSEQHTPLAPHKNRIRRNWMTRVSPRKDIITISHGLLDMAMALRWRGRIQVCDIDHGVRESVCYLREGCNGGSGDYPDLNILPPKGDIANTVWDYCKTYGPARLGAVDVDLADTLTTVWPIMQRVLIVLSAYGYQGETLLTFRNGRDQFSSIQQRLRWMKRHLPKDTRYLSHEEYYSLRIREDASRTSGSTMCIVALGCN